MQSFAWEERADGSVARFTAYVLHTDREVHPDQLRAIVNALPVPAGLLNHEQAVTPDVDVFDKIDAGVEPGITSLGEHSAEAVGQATGGVSRERGQGFQLDQEVKAATEAHAMNAAIEFYRRDWEVRDVHATKSYDLSCHRAGEERHVEVKGTTTDGAEVILTPSEVAHARTYPHPALFILRNVNIDRAEDGTAKASGGERVLLDPWNIAAGILIPLAYKYHVPSPSDNANPCGSRSVPGENRA